MSISRPCDVVVSAHASPKERNPAFLGGHGGKGVQQVAGGSCQPVEPCHADFVARLKLIEQSAKLRAVGLGPARHPAEHLLVFGLANCRT